MLRGHFLSSPRPRNGRREGRRPRFLPASPRRPPKRRSTREVHGAGRGGVGRALSRHGSAWPVMLRAAGTGSQGPAPGRAGPLSGNAKPEAWLPDLLRYSVCCCLAKRRDTTLPLPWGATALVLLCAVLHGRGTGSAPALSYLGRAVPRGTRWASTEPSTWPLVVGRRLVAQAGGTFLHSESGLHRLPWGNL